MNVEKLKSIRAFFYEARKFRVSKNMKIRFRLSKFKNILGKKKIIGGKDEKYLRIVQGKFFNYAVSSQFLEDF